MSQQPTLVRFGAKGGVFLAPSGTSPTSPTDATGASGGSGPSGFTDVGLISDDGVQTSKSIDVTKTKAWGAGVVRTSVTDAENTFQFTMLESNADVMGLYYGADPSATGTSGAKFEIAVPGLPGVLEFRMVIDWYEVQAGSTKAFRFFLPRATVTNFEDVTVNTTDPVQYGITVEAQADSAGKAFYIWGASADIDGTARIATGFEID